MLQRFIIFCFILFSSLGVELFAQGYLPPGTYTSVNKKAIKQHEEGKKNMDLRKSSDAEKCFLKALEIDPNFVEPHTMLGYLYAEERKFEEAIVHFKRATEINPKFFPANFYDLGWLSLNTGKYDLAKSSLESYLAFPRISPELKERSERFLKNAIFGIENLKSPKSFSPKNMGVNINSSNDEYFPTLTSDNKTFIYTRRLPGSGHRKFQEDMYVSIGVENEWLASNSIGPMNSESNDGAPSIAANGEFMFYVIEELIPRSGDYPFGIKGFGSCDIFFSQKVNGKWTKPVNVGAPINTGNWETQPSFSSDGKTLYFVRGIKGGRDGNIGEQDIYTSQIGPDGKFSSPVKLGPNINTAFREESVLIHPDNMTLYFSSDGHVGMGGLDIYMSKRQADGNWGPAINIGYPINTWNDENSLLVDPSGQLAYFASDRTGGLGGLDIYQFEMPKEMKPEKITYVKGKVYDSKTNQPLGTDIELFDLETQALAIRTSSNSEGNFLVTLTANKNYMVNVSRPGYLFYSDNFSLKDVEADFNKPYTLNVPLQPIDTGMVVELKNVFFDVNLFDLKPTSKVELDKLVSFLVLNSKLKIELSGHTDNSGDKKLNKTLSQNRAKSVYDYLIVNGKIDAARLTFKGYGDAKPKVANDTPENKAKNRRTEFKVTGFLE